MANKKNTKASSQPKGSEEFDSQGSPVKETEKENVSPNKQNVSPSKTGRLSPKSTLSVPKENRISLSKRAGVVFPVTKVLDNLRKKTHVKRIQKGSAVYLASVLEYLTAEVLELAGTVATENKRVRIIPRHLLFAIENDAELSRVFNPKGTCISGSGVIPFVHKQLLKVKTAPKKNKINLEETTAAADETMDVE